MVFTQGSRAACKRLIAMFGLLLLALISLGVGVGTAHADTGACQLLVPASPMTAQGLATPWQLQPGCSESDPNAAVFVQSVILNRDTGQLSTYSPLVVDAGTSPAVTPVVPNLPANADVAIFGGGDDNVTTLIGSGASSCVNGADGREFGQVFFCGTAQFWQDVNAAVQSGKLVVPPIGKSPVDGQVCPTVRDFRIVDQDQSDNVQTTYLALPDGSTAQNTAANRAALSGWTVMKNPSDNRVLSIAVDGALQCQPWKIPDLADGGTLVPTQATDELQAAMYQGNPVALVPSGDPMVGPNVLDMVNAYRAGVDQPQIHALGEANTQAYCAHIHNTAPGFLASHQALFSQFPTPVPGIGNNLYDFLSIRLAATFQLLGCNQK